MKQQMKVNKAKRHMVRVTEDSYKLIRKLAKVRDQSDTLTLEQIIQDYIKLTSKENLK